MFLKNIGVTFFTEISLTGISFLNGILLARLLSVEDRGIMVLLMSFPMLIIYLSNFGIPHANIYMIGRKKVSNRTVYGNAFTVSIFISFFTIILLQILKKTIINSFLKGFPEMFWFPLMILIFFNLLLINQQSIIIALERFDLLNPLRSISPVLQLIFFAVFLGFFRSGLHAAIIIFISSTLFSFLIISIFLQRIVPLKLGFNKKLTLDSFIYGTKSFSETLFVHLNYRLDIYLVAYFLDAEQVALYGVATSFAEVIWNLPNSIGTVLFPHLSGLPLEKIHALSARVCRFTLAASALLSIGLLAGSWIIFPIIYGAAYKGSIPVFLTLLPGIIFMSVYKVITRDFASYDRQKYAIFTSAASLAIITLLDILLIPKYGIIGAGIASSIGYCFAAIVVLAFFTKESGLSPAKSILIQPEDLKSLKNKLKNMNLRKNNNIKKEKQI